MTSARESYGALIDHVRQATLLAATARVLTWDQETVMPTGGRGAPAVEYRSRQLAQLAGQIHALQTDRRIGDSLAACESDASFWADPHSAEATNVREIRREYEHAVKLPGALVEALSRAASMGKHAWAEARKANDFSLFRPRLEEVVRLCREKAACWGAPSGDPWDALADWHEPGMNARQVAELFGPLRQRLVELLDDLSGRPVDDPLAGVVVDTGRQREVSRSIAERLGFDFSRGRCDESQHPFCLPLHRDDVRMTSRFREDQLLDGLGSTMHEAGHGIYNQNLPGDLELLDTPASMPLRYAVHETRRGWWRTTSAARDRSGNGAGRCCAASSVRP